MSLLNKWFHPTKKESLVFIDIGAGSVAGAYANFREDGTPTLLYTRRLPIEVRGDEPHERAMLRALDVLGAALIHDGAPALARYTGSGSADAVLVSIDAPWQETRVRTEVFERKTPFTFTKAMVTTAIEKTSASAPGKLLADESIIGTTLNGYETHKPYGKKARRASIIVLTSLIEENVSESIVTSLRSLFHTKKVLSIAGSSLRYQAMRAVFPHERSALILDTIGSLLSISLVRRGLLVAVTEVKENVSVKNTGPLVQKIVDEFTELAKRFPLPRTIFLLDKEEDASSLEKALNAAKLAGLWLSDNPPTIVSVSANHISEFVHQTTPASADLPLLLMVLYWQHRSL
ncbi:hypothetical protein HKL94_02640 [Candidatus Parcubacteria bacterium]|nr:hypothetical protein [Candidatus Parcubacteria bacterium]